MHSNSNESCGNFYKNTNAQPFQINATTEEHFQKQSRNNLKVENSTCKDIALNQRQSKGLCNEVIQ